MINFKDSFFGRCIIYFDAVVLYSEWTIWVGLGIGLLIGINSLISVLAQYKSLSVTLTDGAIDDSRKPNGPQNYRDKRERAIERLEKLQLRCTKWSDLIKVYPLKSTVLFFGILLSTAVLQLIVTGGVSTVIICSLASFPEAYQVVQPVFSFIVAWLVISLVDSIVMQDWMVERVLTNEYQFKHPNIWILYTLVYTMLNLIVGILHAFWRLALFVVLSISRFNRLDRSLFPAWQRLDQGHNAFFSMVLMHYTIQRNSGNVRAIQPLVAHRSRIWATTTRADSSMLGVMNSSRMVPGHWRGNSRLMSTPPTVIPSHELPSTSYPAGTANFGVQTSFRLGVSDLSKESRDESDFHPPSENNRSRARNLPGVQAGVQAGVEPSVQAVVMPRKRALKRLLAMQRAPIPSDQADFVDRGLASMALFGVSWDQGVIPLEPLRRACFDTALPSGSQLPEYEDDQDSGMDVNGRLPNPLSSGGG